MSRADGIAHRRLRPLSPSSRAAAASIVVCPSMASRRSNAKASASVWPAFGQAQHGLNHGPPLRHLAAQAGDLAIERLPFVELLPRDQQRAVDAGIADRLDQMGVGALPAAPIPPGRAPRCRSARSAASALRPAPRASARRRPCRHRRRRNRRAPHPAGRSGQQISADEPDRRELAQHRRTVGMGAVQHQRPRAAEMGNAAGPRFMTRPSAAGAPANRPRIVTRQIGIGGERAVALPDRAEPVALDPPDQHRHVRMLRSADRSGSAPSGVEKVRLARRAPIAAGSSVPASRDKFGEDQHRRHGRPLPSRTPAPPLARLGEIGADDQIALAAAVQAASSGSIRSQLSTGHRSGRNAGSSQPSAA